MAYDAMATDERAATREYVTVTTYAEAEEVLRRAQEFSISGNKPGARDYLADHVATVDGRRHLERRRLYRDLFGLRGLDRHDRAFAAAIQATLEHYLRRSPGTDGVLRFDLIEALRRAYGQVIADLIGLDLAQDAPGWGAFQRAVHAVVEVVASDFSRGDLRQVHEDAHAAKEHVRTELLVPALERRRGLLARARAAGEDPWEALPGDVVAAMVIAQDEDPERYGFDEDTILRECLGFLVGGANNPSASAAWSLAELEGWLADHPDDRARLSDRDFLEGVVRESLRLHRTGAPFLIRRALTDVTLRCSGRDIPADGWVAVDVPSANRDPLVFGDDADRFDPRRRPVDERERAYGLAFATGPHVCIARPMMIDDDARSDRAGLQVDVLRALLDAGVRTDPDREPVPAAHGGDRFAAYPVVVDQADGA